MVNRVNIYDDSGEAILSFCNPKVFSNSTLISYQLPEANGSPDDITLNIYNISGRCIRNLVNEKYTPGIHKTTWDGMDDNGNPLPSGSYFYKLNTGKLSVGDKFILIK